MGSKSEVQAVSMTERAEAMATELCDENKVCGCTDDWTCGWCRWLTAALLRFGGEAVRSCEEQPRLAGESARRIQDSESDPLSGPAQYAKSRAEALEDITRDIRTLHPWAFTEGVSDG